MPLMPFSLLRRRRAVSGASSDDSLAAPSFRWTLWLAVLLAVLALHWGAGRWVDRSRNGSNPAPAEHVPVQVELLTPKPVAQAPAPAAEAPKPAPAPRPAPQPAHAITSSQKITDVAGAQKAQTAQA